MAQHQKLTPEQEEQIRGMRKAGKSAQECIAFMKSTYNIDVPAWKISYIVGKASGKKPAKGKRKYHKREDQQPSDEGSIEQDIADIDKGMDMIVKGNRALFMHFRLLVIKEAGKVLRACKSAGIDMEDIKD
jgi:hypothetical protein